MKLVSLTEVPNTNKSPLAMAEWIEISEMGRVKVDTYVSASDGGVD